MRLQTSLVKLGVYGAYDKEMLAGEAREACFSIGFERLVRLELSKLDQAGQQLSVAQQELMQYRWRGAPFGVDVKVGGAAVSLLLGKASGAKAEGSLPLASAAALRFMAAGGRLWIEGPSCCSLSNHDPRFHGPPPSCLLQVVNGASLWSWSGIEPHALLVRAALIESGLWRCVVAAALGSRAEAQKLPIFFRKPGAAPEFEALAV